MDTIRPVSAIVSIKTDPSFRLYDNRSALLERMDSLELTQQFRVKDDEVSLILDGPRELRVGLEDISFTSFVGPVDDALVGILDIVDDVIAPTATSLTIGLQYLIPIDRDYDAARKEVAQGLVGGMARATGLTDFAILFDGVFGEPGVEFQAEFGVVNADESPLRLGGFVGRLTGRRGTPLMGKLISRAYPEVSLFCDSRWTPELPDRVNFSVQVAEQLRITSESSKNMVSELCRSTSLRSGLEA